MTHTIRLIKGGRVFTADANNPWADAIVVEDGQIIFVGDAEAAIIEAGP